MVTLLARHRVKPGADTTLSVARVKRLLASAAVARTYLEAMRAWRPGSGGSMRGGLTPRAYTILQGSMGRVALMTERERDRARTYPVPHTAGLGHQGLQLRIKGLPYWEIASLLDADEEYVRTQVAAQLNRVIGAEVRDADTARMLHLERADAILAANWARAMAGNVDAATIVLRCMDRQSRLLGLDAPQKVDITHRLRLLAEQEGLDPDELIAEAHQVLKSLPK